jgi:type II secretory pathway predicted ATPase ExeA
MQCHLGPLDAEETGAYVQHRLRIAGRSAPLFDGAALALLYEHSGGVPRRINIIAANALVEGFGRSAEVIGPEIVEDVVNDEA